MTTEAFVGSAYYGGGTLGDIKPSGAPSTLSGVVGRFLASPEASRYEGLWVALDENAVVIDRDLSPSALQGRLPGRDGVVITFASLASA